MTPEEHIQGELLGQKVEGLQNKKPVGGRKHKNKKV